MPPLHPEASGPVVLDLDGVVAEFNQPYWELLKRLGAEMRPFERHEPAQWNWEADHGAEESHVDRAWGRILSEPAWWSDLPEHTDMIAPGAWRKLRALAASPQVPLVVLTNRPVGSELASSQWLWPRLFPYPVPISCVRDKAAEIAHLNARAVIEDSERNLSNAVALGWKGVPLLVTRSYNAKLDTPHLVRVDSTSEAIERCLELL